MPLTSKQKEYLTHCNRRWNVKVGATGSGKSFVDMAATIPLRIKNAKDEGLLILMGNTRGTLERNILEPMRSIWPSCVGTIRADSTVIVFGKKCYALGADNKKHVARIQGATFEYVYGDEVTTWSEEVFQMLKSRLRCEHSHFDGTCNPDYPGHWFKTFLDSDADIYLQHYVIEDGVLPPYVVDELKKEYAGTVYYQRYILGEWALAEGLIYPMHNDAIAEPTDETALKTVVSIDYGTENAFAALIWEYHADGVWYAVDEYYYSGRDTGVTKTDDEYGSDMDAFTAHIDGKIRTIIDPSAASFIALLQRKKRYGVIAADNSVLDGIRETATAMQTGKIKISPRLKNWKKEAEGYVWDDTSPEDRPVKANDHLMDSMRYFVKTMMIAAKRKQEVNAYENLSGSAFSWR